MKARLIDYVFDREKWGQVLSELIPDSEHSAYAALFSVSESSIYAWKTGRMHKETPYPNMTNFLTICNMADVNPSDFFVPAGHLSDTGWTCSHHHITKMSTRHEVDGIEGDTILIMNVCRDCGETVSTEIVKHIPPRKDW